MTLLKLCYSYPSIRSFFKKAEKVPVVLYFLGVLLLACVLVVLVFRMFE